MKNRNNITLIIVVFLSALAGTVLAILLMNSAGYIGTPKDRPDNTGTQQAQEDSSAEDGLRPSVTASGDMFDGLPDPDYTGEEADKLNNEILLKYKKILLALDKAVQENVPEGAVDSTRAKCHAQVYDYDGDGLYEMVVTFTANSKEIFAGLYRYNDKNGAEGIVRKTQKLGELAENNYVADIRIGISDGTLYYHCIFTMDKDGTEYGKDFIYCLDRENITPVTSLDWTGGKTPVYRKDGAECSADTFNSYFSTQSYRVSSYSYDSPGFNLQEVFG